MNSNHPYSEPQCPSDGDRGQHVGGSMFGSDVPVEPLFVFETVAGLEGRLTSFWVPAR